MYGPFTHRLTWEQVHGLYHLADPRQAELDLKPRCNVAPTDVMPVCRPNQSGRVAGVREGKHHINVFVYRCKPSRGHRRQGEFYPYSRNG
jgi:hypothetical protein